jgi:Uma2 family endonuclease
MNRPFQPPGVAQTGLGGFTADEFLRMLRLGAFDEMKVELVDGRIVRMNPAHSRHGEITGQIVGLLFAILGPRRIFIDTVLQLGGATVRAFDVAVLREGCEPGEVLAPDNILLGIEVADSSLEIDLGEKQRDYATAGIAHYWVADVAARVVHVMSQPESAAYREREVVRFGEALDLPGKSGTISLS